MNKYDYIVFDCDGVILDSNEVKSQAFYDVAKKYGEKEAKELYEYHKNAQGISRFVKFKYLFEELLKRDDYQKDYKDCLYEYGKITREKVFASNFTEGFLDFFKTLNQDLFVISGTPKEEVQKILEHKGISDSFKLILGSPKTKYENLQEVQDYLGDATKKGLFFGDGKVDYESAHEYGLDFCFISKYTDMKDHLEYFKNKKIIKVNTFKDL